MAIIAFLHWKMLCAWRIYTSVRLFFQLFHGWICTLRVDKNCVFYTWKCYLPEEYTPLYECFSIFSLKNVNLCLRWQKWCFLHLNMFLPEEYTPLYKLTKLVFSTLKNIFYLKNVLFLGECFIEGILSNTIIANSHRGKYSSIKENEKHSHKGVYSLSGRHFQVWKCHYTQFAQRWIFFNKRKLKTLAQRFRGV